MEMGCVLLTYSSTSSSSPTCKHWSEANALSGRVPLRQSINSPQDAGTAVHGNEAWWNAQATCTPNEGPSHSRIHSSSTHFSGKSLRNVFCGLSMSPGVLISPVVG
jgi:hypothetical protein